MPQDAAPTPPSPSPEYDFILKDKQTPKKGFSLPSFGLPKVARIILLVVLVLFVIVTIAALASGKRGSSSKDLLGVLARGQEIVRVSKVVEPLAQNHDTQNLVATTELSLTSSQNQIISLLKKSHVKIDSKALSADLNKTTDTQMQTALQNNRLDSAYGAYLKTSLTDYQNQLRISAKGASKNVLDVLNKAYSTADTILTTPEVSNATGP